MELEPDYAEVLYHYGICLAKLSQYRDALEAFYKAESLGIIKNGLKQNINTCQRAVTSGYY